MRALLLALLLGLPALTAARCPGCCTTTTTSTTTTTAASTTTTTAATTTTTVATTTTTLATTTTTTAATTTTTAATTTTTTVTTTTATTTTTLPPITATVLAHGTGGLNTVYTSTSVSPSANTIVVAAVNCECNTTCPPNAPTIAGGGITTWNSVADGTYSSGGGSNFWRLTIVYGIQGSPGSAAVTFTYPQSCFNAVFQVFQLNHATTFVTTGTATGFSTAPAVTGPAISNPLDAGVVFYGWDQDASHGLTLNNGTAIQLDALTGNGLQTAFQINQNAFTGTIATGNKEWAAFEGEWGP